MSKASESRLSGRHHLLLWSCAVLAAWAGQAEAPRELALLTSIKHKMRQNLQQVPNYTCLETVERARRLPRSLVVSRGGGPGPFRLQDVVRLEVAEVGRKEFFSPPGAHQFEENDHWAFVNGGMFGNGIFALFSHDIFVSNNATYHFAGEENAEGRTLVRYDYQVSYLSSGYTIQTDRGQAKVAFRGAFWADPRTLQAVRVDVNADEIPPHLGVSDTKTRIHYARTRIGTSDVLLPQSAEMTMRHFFDSESRNRIEFTHCRQYTAESVISFDTDEAAHASAPGGRLEDVGLPSGLSLAIGLETAIDLETASVGDLVSGKTQTDVKHKGRVLVPKGAVVSGRLRRVEKYEDPTPRFVVSLEFSEIAFTGHRARFFAAMEKIVDPSGTERIEKIPTPNLPGVGTFSVSGGRLPAGLRTAWKTMRYDQE